MAIGHKQDDAIIIDLVYAKQPPFNASAVVAEICAIARSYGIDTVVSDRFSAGFMQAELQRGGMGWKASEFDKSGLYSIAMPIFTSGMVRLTDDRATVEQFCILERRPGSSGRDRIDARGGKSEDSANAVAGVVSLLAQAASPAENWIAYYARLAGEAGVSFNRNGVDMDDTRTPGPPFGWNLTSEPLVRLMVPKAIANEGMVNGRCLRRIGDNAIAEMTRAEARKWLTNVAWRSLNEKLAAELLKEGGMT
jgi:hypothetical protein